MRYRIKAFCLIIIISLCLNPSYVSVCPINNPDISSIYMNNTDRSMADCSIIINTFPGSNMETVLNDLTEYPEIHLTDHVDNFLFADVHILTHGLSDSNNSSDSDPVAILLDRVRNIEGIRFVEIDSDIELSSISDDYYSDTQWVLDNQGSYKNIVGTTAGVTYSTPDIDLDMPETWELYNSDTYAVREVVVAVIDTGVDYKHQDLRDNMWTNPGEIPDDGIDNDGNGYVDDVYGWDFYNGDSTVCHYEYNSRLKQDFASSTDCDDHGTHCAGIIAATANNKVGIAGVASNIDVKIMSLKIHGGTNRKGSITDAVKAIKYAEQSGADICNMSWGTYTDSDILYTAMKESGMLFITAAGNDGSNNDKKPLYPASFDLDNIISVGYVDANGVLSPNSNYGEESVDITIPSVDVFSTTVGTYSSMSGSSMAAAHMTGLAAIIYSSGYGLFPLSIRDFIVSHIKPLDNLKGYVKYAGIPSSFLMMQDINSLIRDTIPPTISISRSFRESSILLSLNYSDDLSGINQIRYFIGKKKLEDFSNGTSGIAISSNELLLAKSGFYTFYVRDNAGNVTIYPYYVFDDNLPPIISYAYNVSFDYSSINIAAKINDTASGVKTVKYDKGSHTNSYFSNSSVGTPLELDGSSIKFIVNTPGKYSVYAVDYRGNGRTFVINPQIVKSTSLKLTRSKKTLSVGKTYTIKYTMLPDTTTDAVKFKSSDKKIAKVSKNGKITALKPGKATITVTTASGLKKKIKITVKKP